MGFWDDSGISWTICKQSAPRSRQTTTPTPHRSIFTGQMLFLTPNQQCQSSENTTSSLRSPEVNKARPLVAVSDLNFPQCFIAADLVT